MQIAPDNWVGPGSGGVTVAPNTFWLENAHNLSSWSIQAQAFNASGALVTVANWTLFIWDLTSNSAGFTQNAVNANTINIAASMATAGHRYAYAVSFTTGSCDHTVISTTAIDGTAGDWSNHVIYSIRNAANTGWIGIGGPAYRVRNAANTAWIIVNGGEFVRNSANTAWIAP